MTEQTKISNREIYDFVLSVRDFPPEKIQQLSPVERNHLKLIQQEILPLL